MEAYLDNFAIEWSIEDNLFYVIYLSTDDNPAEVEFFWSCHDDAFCQVSTSEVMNEQAFRAFRIKTASGKSLVSSSNREFLEFLIDDFDRCEKLSFVNDGGIDFNNTACAYAIYSDQTDILEPQKGKLLQIIPLYDQCFWPRGLNGPEEAELIGQYMPLRSALEDVIGIEGVEHLVQIFLGNYEESSISYDDLGNVELISEEEFIGTDVSKRFFAAFSELSLNQQGAIYGLWNLTGRQSFLAAFVLITKRLSIAVYMKIIKRTPEFYIDNLSLESHFISEEESKYWDSLSEMEAAELDDEIPEVIQAALEDRGRAKALEYRNNRDLQLELNANLCQSYSTFSDNPEVDSLLAEIKVGESIRTEFKSSFFLCLRTNKAEKHIEHSSMKSIVGFENKEGGKLYIGVDDSGEILGVNREIDLFHKGYKDKYILRMKDRLKSSIKHGLVNVEIDLRKIDDLFIVVITVKKSNEPSFLIVDKKEKFYVRQGPSTELLEASQLLSYCKSRFSSS